ncbi:MAG: ABC transporter ATP-binding protein [Bacteroidaceae bacterium]|nr:ABC transporter ATP-binding protein [Bacteroidaceae bacterium]
MLEIKNLTFAYRGTKDVISDLSLEFKEGGVYGLLGKNGTGKSTLLYLIMGLLKPRMGEVMMDGKNTFERHPDTLSQMFIVPEEYEMPNTTLDKYVEALRPFYPNFDEQVLNDCLEVFEMPTNMNLKDLSMGQKKKVYISLALSIRSKVLLMDEPTNGLDIPAKSQFRKALARGMNDEQIIIISTHQVRDVEMIIDHVTMINDNQVLMNEALDPETPVNLEELFLKKIGAL